MKHSTTRSREQEVWPLADAVTIQRELQVMADAVRKPRDVSAISPDHLIHTAASCRSYACSTSRCLVLRSSADEQVYGRSAPLFDVLLQPDSLGPSLLPCRLCARARRYGRSGLRTPNRVRALRFRVHVTVCGGRRGVSGIHGGFHCQTKRGGGSLRNRTRNRCPRLRCTDASTSVPGDSPSRHLNPR